MMTIKNDRILLLQTSPCRTPPRIICQLKFLYTLALCVLLSIIYPGVCATESREANVEVDLTPDDFNFDDESQGGDSRRCIGLQANFEKLKDIQRDDLEKIANPQGNRKFSIFSQTAITRADSTEVMADRIRMFETIENVPIRGADAVVSLKGCEEFICPIEVKGLAGKTFTDINVTAGYTTDTTEEQVIEKLMQVFGADADGVGALSLEVYVATDRDYLAYFTDVLVERDDSMRYYTVIVDAHSSAILSICNMLGFPQAQDQQPVQRYLRNLQQETTTVSVNGINCGSCAGDSGDITWSNEYSSCPINTLYLNDEGRETTCLIGKTEDGKSVFGAGPVPSLYWEGTQDCKSTTSQCQTTVLPECSDAISDVQYGAIKTLTYFQEYLGIMGGLRLSSSDPVPIKANVHYSRSYCNAFYRFSSNTVFFGDCDCSYWTPLTSIDIVAHEIAHGVTKHTSGLEYQYQSGGLNEAMSDVVGTVLEFMLDDFNDTPDFTVGEMLGNKLRSMEYPGEISSAISSACEYRSTLDVHSASGPPNKAFVHAIRQCESNGCSDLKGCTILIGTIFMYANIESLTTYSGYQDAAKATCGIVNEFYAAKSPATKCSADYVTTFIRQGWISINIALDATCEQVFDCCSDNCPEISPASLGPTPNPTPGPPTTPSPSDSPVAGPQTISPTLDAPPELEPEEEGDQNIILRIYQWLSGLVNSVAEPVVSIFQGRDGSQEPKT